MVTVLPGSRRLPAKRDTSIANDSGQEELTEEQRAWKERILRARPEDDPAPTTERTRALVEFGRRYRDVMAWQRLQPSKRNSAPLQEREELLQKYEAAAELCLAAGISKRDRLAVGPLPGKELDKLVLKMNKESQTDDPADKPIQRHAYWICPHCGHQVLRTDLFDLELRDSEREFVTCTSNSCGKDFRYSEPVEETAWRPLRFCLLCLKAFTLNKHSWTRQGPTCSKCKTKRRDRRKYLRKKLMRQE